MRSSLRELALPAGRRGRRPSPSAPSWCWRSATTRSPTYALLIGSALTWPDGIGYTLFYATPLIFTGLAVAVAFRCGLLNIGAEGQLYVAAFATAWVGITCAGPAGRGCCCRCASSPRSLAGGFWGAVPGVLKARFGATRSSPRS